MSGITGRFVKGGRATYNFIVGAYRVAVSPHANIPKTVLHPRMPPYPQTFGEIVNSFDSLSNRFFDFRCAYLAGDRFGNMTACSGRCRWAFSLRPLFTSYCYQVGDTDTVTKCVFVCNLQTHPQSSTSIRTRVIIGRRRIMAKRKRNRTSCIGSCRKSSS